VVYWIASYFKMKSEWRNLVADVADDLCATHRVNNDEQSADSDKAAVGKAACGNKSAEKGADKNATKREAPVFLNCGTAREGEWKRGPIPG
jgi:hypothetical protein